MTMRQNTVRAVKGESTMRRAAEKFCRNKLAVISLIILLVLILLAIFADKNLHLRPVGRELQGKWHD